ncbi:GspE/PulE/PilB domain-containing protein [Nostoc sp. UHCC 0870]|uniref:GspE/PulE/PilB domain-containing protein n=1 Tax=Nostoc sp. UHCC 0870 TaxID=2914041 RepID=UPI001EDFFC8D|nr:pilus assembly protein PilB [Nostoc sp. UHCC 0870]UKO98592.1 pilus assembly protein PilB [Nostoc sp. UHCC 0870]
MWSPEGKPADSGASRQEMLHTTPSIWEQEPEREQIFKLIDTLLSFEACLYHQILPLRLENKQLLLGMVHPLDNGALDYVNRILSYVNYTMMTQEIAIATHRTILSVYLTYKNTSPPDNQPIEELETKTNLEQHPQDNTAEIDITSPSSENKYSATTHQPPEQQINSSAQTPNVVPSVKNQPEENVGFDDVTVLQLHPPEVFTSIEALTSLPPKKLLEELLARVLSGGIGRLYLERQPYQGRIIWSDNGVLQSVLEDIPLSIFQGVLNELKRFGSLPVTRHAEPRQIEKECLYQQTRVLLRIRVMPGSYGEEATLQVLRGAALKFYQQQQLVHLSRDVIGISQQLSHKLHELNQRLLLNPVLKPEDSEAIVALNQLIENLDNQIKILAANNQLPI